MALHQASIQELQDAKYSEIWQYTQASKHKSQELKYFE